jgi:N-ethylmaleimide reductase
MSDLFSPLQLGALTLSNRMLMAALTRARAGRSHMPNALMADYYAQRASAGLIMTEATMIASDACAFTGEGGLFDQACIDGWKLVTEAVHARGGKIAVQLWHPGRAAHSSLNDGVRPVSAGDKAIAGSKIHTPSGKHAYEVPRQLDQSEIAHYVELFASAAKRAVLAGFDGVQIHAAHGYLIDQFLRDGMNQRSDIYGGSLPARAKFLLDIVDAVAAIIDPSRISVRISPLVAFNDMTDSNPQALVQYVAEQLSARNVGALEMRHENFADPAEQVLAHIAREHFKGSLWVNGGYDFASGQQAIISGSADAVVFGKAFLANPDLPQRWQQGGELNAVDFSTLYTPGPKGYTDYPSLS